MNAFKETRFRNDDELQRKWSGKHDPKLRGDIDFTGDPGETDPSHAKDCDINNIVATYHKTGVFPEAGAQVFADVADAPSYQDAMQIVINAENAFMALDATTRRKFDNDPTQMLRFLENPENVQEAIKLGMMVAKAPTPLPPPQKPAPEAARARKTDTKAPSITDDEEN